MSTINDLGLLTTREVVQAIKESGRLTRPFLAPRFDYFIRSRGIAPTTKVGGACLWPKSIVEEALGHFVSEEQRRAAIVKPSKPRKSR